MIAIGPTDINWFNNLKKTSRDYDLINFWTPTSWNFKALNQGEKFYFLLKSPIRKIGGYGYFHSYEEISPYEAWKEFDYANGVSSYEELKERIDKYAGKHSERYRNNKLHKIGCILLSNPLFLNEDEYFDPNEYEHPFSKHIVKFKGFDEDFKGLPISHKIEDFDLINHPDKKTLDVTVKDRSGQSKFRNEVFQAYKGRCAITGEDTEEILEASHIQPHQDSRSNHIQNGILLRVDIHRLFDTGYLTINKSFEIKVSKKLHSAYYRKLEGQFIDLPKDTNKYPAEKSIEFHRKNIFMK